MNWDKTNRWLTLASNLAVVAGLVLVTVQIRQNTEITRAQVINDYYLADLQLELAMMGDDPATSWSKAVYAPDELDAYDAAVLDRYFNYGVVQLARLERMERLGLLDGEVAERAGYLRWHLGNEVGRRWWEQYVLDEPTDFLPEGMEVLGPDSDGENRRMLDALLGPGGTR